MMSQSAEGDAGKVTLLLNTLRWRVSHRPQAWQRLAAFCKAAQSISAKPAGKALRAMLGVAVAAGTTGEGAVWGARAKACTAGMGCHTRTPMAANMARCRVFKDSVMCKPSPLQAHDHRVLTLMRRQGVVVFALTLQVKAMGLVQSNAGLVACPHL